MIQLTDVQFQYPRSTFRLRVPELHVAAGSKLAVVGPSGSGKTTLLQLICGILLPRHGRVTTRHVEVSALGEAARRRFRVQNIGLVFQEFELVEHLHVWDNIVLPGRISGAVKIGPQEREHARELAAAMGLSDKLKRYVRRLSQGERQRVALCRALVMQPPLLLCDEPTGNLDTANKERVMDILLDQVERYNTTLLTVTHDHGLLPRFDRTIDFRQYHDLSASHD